MCTERGYYDVPTGYRKIPGNICISGINLVPAMVKCTTSGYIGSFFSLKKMMIMAVVSAVLYFGWPIVEAILIVLPIPDPKDINGYCISFMEWLQKLGGSTASDSEGQAGKSKKEDQAYG